MPRKYTTRTFVEKARMVHGDTYDYSKSVYTGSMSKVLIKCKIHGEFWQHANNHLRGYGCPVCQGKNRNRRGFLKKCKEVHGDKYDYSLATYVDAHTKVKIKCKNHGVFEQLPLNHLAGSGCPYCCESKGERKIRLFLQKHNIPFKQQYQINKPKIKSGRYRYDFYIPSANLLIEYDGGQHYFPVNHWGGEEQFQKQKRNDLHKNRLAEQAGISLLRISYQDFDIIGSILSGELLNKIHLDIQLSIFNDHT